MENKSKLKTNTRHLNEEKCKIFQYAKENAKNHDKIDKKNILQIKKHNKNICNYLSQLNHIKNFISKQ